MLRSLWSYPERTGPFWFEFDSLQVLRIKNTIVGSISDTTMHATETTFVKRSRAESCISGQANSKELKSKCIQIHQILNSCICPKRQPATLLESEILKEESRTCWILPLALAQILVSHSIPVKSVSQNMSK